LPGQEDPDRRRRRTERLRARERPRGERDGGRLRGERARGPRRARREPGRRPRPDGHHDAGARRLRGDPLDPQPQEVREAAYHLAHREGDEGRPREERRRRRLRLHHEAGRHRPAPEPDAGVALPVANPEAASAAPHDDLERIEIDVLLEAAYRRYGFDFREYAYASLKRPLWRRTHAE